MSGVVGGAINSTIAAENTPIHGRRNEVNKTFAAKTWELLLRYPEDDPTGYQLIQEGNTAVCVYGAVTTTIENLNTRVFSEPEKLASETDGTFLIVGFDISNNKIVVITDKLGGHPCYYVPGDPVFATSVAPCISALDATIDIQAVSDFLLLGHCWGDRTLVNEVKSMRPASVYTFENGDWAASRYWKPSYEEHEPGQVYLDELANRFNTAVKKTVNTIPNRAGLWLSGGLDSRTTAAAFSDQSCRLNAYTYNANPPTGDNPVIAHRVGNKLDISVRNMDITEESTSTSRIERLIDVCDGMVRWNTTLNLSASYDVPEPIIFEGVEGSLMGDHLLKPHLTEYTDPVESQLASEAWQPVEVVQNILSVDTDIRKTLQEEAKRANEGDFRKNILDIHFQNYYNRLALASNSVIRDCAGDRVVYTDGKFLDWCASLPIKYRKGTFPGTSISTGTSRAKLGLTRRVAKELVWITYERTKLPPSVPYLFHPVGFLTNAGLNRMKMKQTYGNGQLSDIWLRNNNEIANWTLDLLTKASERGIFDQSILEYWDRHQSGENLSPVISQITTVEWWLCKYVD